VGEGGVDGRKVGMKRGEGPKHEIRDVRGVRTQSAREADEEENNDQGRKEFVGRERVEER